MNEELKQFFEARRLSEQDLGMIEYVLNSPAYEIAFRPHLQQIRDNMHVLWSDRSQKRKDTLPDDYLAGMVAAIDGLLKYFEIIIHESNLERIHESMSGVTPEMHYQRRVEAGLKKPVIGMDQATEPTAYDPAEDF